jgi:ubiquinone/menaquinone biosynthesis C-methylase UbiE
MSKATLALRVLRLKIDGAEADPTPDYDVASSSYDDYFTQVMGRHSVAVLDKVRVEPGMSVIELACGTGHLTAEIARRLSNRGSLRACDKSPGMLAAAQEKIIGGPDLELTWAEGDMAEFLARQPDASADLIVIGWAICYSQPVALLRDVRRTLRPGGQVAIIDTRANALANLQKAFERVVADDPSYLKALIHVNLPRGPRTLDRWFRRAGLKPERVWFGAQERTFQSTSEAIDWLERSGAGAGFRDSFDPARAEDVRIRLQAALEEERRHNNGLTVQHTFVAGIATKD